MGGGGCDAVCIKPWGEGKRLVQYMSLLTKNWSVRDLVNIHTNKPVKSSSYPLSLCFSSLYPYHTNYQGLIPTFRRLAGTVRRYLSCRALPAFGSAGVVAKLHQLTAPNEAFDLRQPMIDHDRIQER